MTVKANIVSILQIWAYGSAFKAKSWSQEPHLFKNYINRNLPKKLQNNGAQAETYWENI